MIPSNIRSDDKAIDHLEWKQINTINYITIKSQFTNTNPRKIFKIYKRSKKLFMRYERQKLKCPSNDTLTINVVSANILRNTMYFADAQPTNFGRYFRDTKTIYILDTVEQYPDWLAHELAHYFYDVCGVEFRSLQDEHSKVYDFQDIYMMKGRFND